LTAAIRRYGGAQDDWLDLSTGINPVSARLPDIAPEAWTRLPDGHLEISARRAAARFYGCAGDDWPLPVPGTQSAIQCLPGLVSPDARAAIVSPTYGEYAHVLSQAGLSVDPVATLREIDPVRHRLAVVVNPNNPDARRFARQDLLLLASQMKAHGGHLVVDEAFADFDRDGPDDQSLAAHALKTPGVIVLRSFGKFFGLAGLRLGFVLAEPDIVQAFARALGPWPVSGPALAIAAHVMGDAAQVRIIGESIAARHAATRAVLDRAGLKVTGETALFFLVTCANAVMLHEALMGRHVLTRRFDYAPDWLRIGLTADDRAARHLAAALAEAAMAPGTSPHAAE